jgi:hypothetical protein
MIYQRRHVSHSEDRRIAQMPLCREPATVTPYILGWIAFGAFVVVAGNLIEWIAPR